jgi:hypothetical protein
MRDENFSLIHILEMYTSAIFILRRYFISSVILPTQVCYYYANYSYTAYLYIIFPCTSLNTNHIKIVLIYPAVLLRPTCFVPHNFLWNLDTSVSKMIRLRVERMEDQVSVQRPYRLWGPQTFQFNRYHGFFVWG